MRYQDNPLIRAKYNCKKWKETRKLVIQRANGLCERCLKNKIYNEGKIVHHIIEINEDNYMDDSIMYNIDNLEFVCDNCHKGMHKPHESYYFDEEGNVCEWQKIR